MLWVNPKPDVEVKAVRFANPERTSIPVLLALTSVVAKNSSVKTQEGLAKAQELFGQACKLVEAKNDVEAEKLLKSAISADPSLASAHQALVELCERKGKDEEVLSACRAWIQAGAHSPYPYNRAGEIMEKRRDNKGAPEAYEKSLKLEWNQLDIIKAKKRVEDLPVGK